jgi:hypothetical protein
VADLEKLERLNRLRESGALSEGEFEQEKAKLLAGQPANPKPLIVIGLIALVIVLLAAFVLSRQTGTDIDNAVMATNSSEPNATSSPFADLASPPSPPSPARLDPPVPKTAEPDPSNADYYNEAKRGAMRAYRNQPAGIREMLGDWAGANTLCRGSSDVATVDKWCPIRDRLSENLEKLSMCYGRPTDQSAADSDWHTCDGRDDPR